LDLVYFTATRAHWAIVTPLRGIGRTILIPGVALRLTPGYSNAATNVANCDRVANCNRVVNCNRVTNFDRVAVTFE
jgi:hypothetical protein